MPEVFLSASASPDGWPEKGRHIGGQKAELVVGMEIIQIIYLKIKLSTTVLPLGHFTDPHPLYCRWFAERRVSLNKNPHHYDETQA
jgi:hypothetical protein